MGTGSVFVRVCLCRLCVIMVSVTCVRMVRRVGKFVGGKECVMYDETLSDYSFKSLPSIPPETLSRLASLLSLIHI